MADDKKKQEGEAEEGKKKGLPAIVLVALGACIGGAGVVFMAPPPPEPKPSEHHEEQPEYTLFEHPDVVSLHFNPRQERGSMVAKVDFQFVYKADKKHSAKVVENIKKHWNQMYSRVLLRLSRETPNGLRDPDNKPHLENDLVREISMSLFPDGEAVVTQILWKGIYVQ